MATNMLKAVLMLCFIGLVASDSASSISSVLSQILGQAKSARNRPVILVINSRALEDSSSSDELPYYRQSSEDELSNGISLLSVLTQLQNSRPSVLSQLQNSRPKPPQQRPRSRFQPRKPQRGVYKSLLSLRNSLRCGARNECKDECTELPKKNQNKCDQKCEKKYECEEEVEDTCNDCGDGVQSTKGPPASDEKCNEC